MAPNTDESRESLDGHQALGLLVFTVVVVVSLFIPMFPLSVGAQFGVAFGAGLPAIYLYRANRRAFAPVLFFVVNALLTPWIARALADGSWQLPQLYFLPSIVVYLVVVLLVPSLRRDSAWMRVGKIDRRTAGLIVATVLISSVALVAWGLFWAEDWSAYRQFIPNVGLGVLVAYGLLFATSNAIFEEFVARAVLFDGFHALSGREYFAVGAQAVVFAVWHYNGFPGGVIGSGMVFVWSIFLGILRLRSRGMLAPLIAHFFADATIALFILFAVVLR